MKTLPPEITRNNSGVALLMVLMALALMAVLCVEIAFTAYVDMSIGRNARDRLQAQYLAKSGARLALIRLQAYKEFQNLVGSDTSGAMNGFKAQSDKVWSMPLPPLPLPGMDAKTPWPGTLSMSIATEGSKIPINLLDGNIHRGSSPDIAKEVIRQLKEIMEPLWEEDDFGRRYRNLTPDDFINPLVDWVDTDEQRFALSGDEDSDYLKTEPAYKPRNDRIATLEEIHFVRGWTDDIYERVTHELSIYNTSIEINPNYISLDRLSSFNPKFSKEDLAQIGSHRLTNSFGSLTDMQTWIRTNLPTGRDFSFPEVLLKKDKKNYRETVFRVEAAGVVGESRRKIVMFVKIPAEPSPVKQQPPSQDSGGESSPQPPKSPEKPAKLLEPEVLFVEESS